MTDARPPDDSFHAPGPPDEEGPYCEEIQHSQVSALVPERVARGVFSTGAVVVQGAHEFILDFLLRMSQPQQVAARVVLPPGVVAQFIAALTDNLNNYQSKFGQPVVPSGPNGPSNTPNTPNQANPAGQPPAPSQSPVSAQDLYEQLKLQDDVLSGNYANAVMIGHTPCEFCFDFITTFFPRLGRIVPRLHGGSGRPSAARLAQTLVREIPAEKRSSNSSAGIRPRARSA